MGGQPRALYRSLAKNLKKGRPVWLKKQSVLRGGNRQTVRENIGVTQN